MSQSEIAYIEVGGRTIAYRLLRGNAPTLVFFPGYASDMEGAKALALDAFAERRGLAMLRFDYSGTGSSGGRLENGTLKLWLDEALAAIDQLISGPIILVGSSMGGWIALHLALIRPERVTALVGIAVGAPAGIAAGKVLWRVFATDFGVVRGNNDGRGDWRVTPDLPRFEITHLEIQPSARVPTCVGLNGRNCPTLIYAATHSQGVWRLDLGGP